MLKAKCLEPALEMECDQSRHEQDRAAQAGLPLKGDGPVKLLHNTVHDCWRPERNPLRPAYDNS
jgi:hypothetical protein